LGYKTPPSLSERVGVRPALVAELVDAQDLKSCLPQGEYGFNSRLGHKNESGETERERFFRFFIFIIGRLAIRYFAYVVMRRGLFLFSFEIAFEGEILIIV
jgi:hypothetical protein